MDGHDRPQDDWPDDVFLDETARFLEEVEADCMGQDEPAHGGTPNFEFRNPYAGPDGVAPVETTGFDHLLDDQALLFDAFEAAQEAEVVPAGGSEEPLEPADPVLEEPWGGTYGSFDSQPPLPEEPDLREPPPKPARSRFVPRRLGSGPAAWRPRAREEPKKGGGEPEVWCVRRGERVTEPDDDMCEGCDADCVFAGGEEEGRDAP